MQGELKSKLFDISSKENVSKYFWSDGGKELILAYRERDGEGVGIF